MSENTEKTVEKKASKGRRAPSRAKKPEATTP